MKASKEHDANGVFTDIPLLLSYYETKTSLLLGISQARTGAVHVMNSGLFQAVRGSGLFSVDPDIGIGEFCNSVRIIFSDKLQKSIIPRL